MDDLKQLITHARDGDLDAFGEVVKRFQVVALRYANAILNDYDLAQDAVQAFLSLPNLHQPDAFAAWFRAIVSRCSNRLIRRKRIPTVSLELAAGVTSDAPGPVELVEKREMKDKVLEAVRELPEHERVVTDLFYFGDCSQNEIADLLGLSVTTVNNRLYSSRRRLKRGELAEYVPIPELEERRKELLEAEMALNYKPTRRKLLKGNVEVNIRAMTRADIPAMRRLDDEISAGLDFANAQTAPGAESWPGGPWSEDEWLTTHFEKYERSGNITLLVEDMSGKLVAFADLWAAQEPEPFGRSLDVECIDYLWEYYGLGIETVLLEEAEKVVKDAGIPAVDIGTNTSSGYYPTLRSFGMNVFYEYDNIRCKTKPVPSGWKPSFKEIPPEKLDKTGLIKISHWSPTDFDHEYTPGRPGVYEFYVDGKRVLADFWRLWEPGYEVPTECELYGPPEALRSPELMAKILKECAYIAGTLGADQIPLPCPCDMTVDLSSVEVVGRKFQFAWFRKAV